MKRNPEREYENKRDRRRTWEEHGEDYPLEHGYDLGDNPLPPITSAGPVPPFGERAGWLPY